MRWFVLIAVLAACQTEEAESPVVINEVSIHSLAGPDWVELHNTGDEPADISGFGLLDGKEGRTAWRIPDGTVLPPRGFYLARRDANAENSPPGFDFGLGEGDSVTLRDGRERTVDQVDFGFDRAPQGRSLGRVRDAGPVVTLAEPTPGQPNTVAPCPGCTAGLVPGPSSKNASMFAEMTVVDLHLTVSDPDWQALQASKENQSKEWVPCAFAYDGETMPAAEIRLKGSEMDWVEPRFQDQFVIRFNGPIDGGRFRGLRRINLDAQLNDPTRIRNNLGMYVMRRAGLVTPRSNHARLFVNGAFYGLYEHIEVIDKEFVEDRFANPTGDLYDGPELQTNQNVSTDARLRELVEAALGEEAESIDAYVQALDDLTDLPSLITLLAAEAALASPKNFWADGIGEFNMGGFGAWNFFLYDNPGSGFVVLPWDLDAVLHPLMEPDADVFAYADPESNTLPAPWSTLQNHPASRALFLAELARVRRDILPELPAVVDRYCALIREPLSQDPNFKYSMAEFEAGCAEIKTFLAQRLQYLDSVLAGQ